MTPQQILERAVRRILAIPGVRTGVRSRWYSSASIPDPLQPRFINGLLRVSGVVTPAGLLDALHAIEKLERRTRLAPNAPRTLDLDIIDMDGLVRSEPDPILPHPRAHLRAFVLLPLRDVAPAWRHPVLGETVQSLIDRLPPQDIVPFP